MKHKILYFSIILGLYGCQSTQPKSVEEEKSFTIPFFNEVINYSENNIDTTQNEKEYMYLIMKGQIELNKGNNKEAINLFEKSLVIKYSDISYKLLSLYYKEQEPIKSKNISLVIYKENMLIQTDKRYENLIIYLYNKEQEKSSDIINDLVSGYNTSGKTINELGVQINIYKEIANILEFTKTELSYIKEKINKEDFTLIEFFHKYHLSNNQGIDPDEALNYLIKNKNKNNLLHNFTIFRTGFIEGYHINSYKVEVNYVMEKVDDFKLDLSILDTFYRYNKEEYEKLKIKLISKYYDNHYFWFFMSDLEKENIDKSLLYSIKTYNIIKKKEINFEYKDILISNIINMQIYNKNFKLKKYFTEINEKDKKSKLSIIIVNMIKNNKFDYELIKSYQNIINNNVDILIAKSYYYLENNDKALEYINKIEEEDTNDDLETNLYKIIILGSKNKKIGLNEAEIFNNTNKTLESELILYYMEYLNDINSKRIEVIMNKKEELKNEDLKNISIYLYAQTYYKNKQYNKAIETMKSLEIENNYKYLADYGRMLWKLNKKEESKKMFNKSKNIFNSLYLKNILKELNIKEGEV